MPTGNDENPVVPDFTEELAARLDKTFATHRQLEDPRREHPWLVGSLGDPNAPVWFLSEAASAWRVDIADPGDSRRLTREDQWAISDGDKAFRQALAKAGLKQGGAFAPGGWRCYITVLSKSSVAYSNWRKLPDEEKFPLFEQWAPVLRWEIEHGKPRVLVAMGGVSQRALRHLVRTGAVPARVPIVDIWSYGYLMQPGPAGTRPMDAARVKQYEAQVAGAARRGAS